MKCACLVVVLAACGTDETPDCSSWHQWGNDPSHAGSSCSDGQSLETALATVIYDPFTAQEEADQSDALVIHYQSPLLDGDDVYMMAKTGSYTPCPQTADGCFDPAALYRLTSQVWTEKRFHWDGAGNLVEQWAFDSAWKPIPGPFFEPMFQPALVGTGAIAVPDAKGQVAVLDRSNGAVIFRIKPFGDDDHPDAYVAGGIAVGHDGSIYYNVIEVDHDAPTFNGARSFLVATDPSGNPVRRGYDLIVPDQPAFDDQCYARFPSDTPLPLPPPPNPDGSPALPPQFDCGSQRPGVNSAPAIGPDGTIFVVSRADFNERYSYITALDPDLTTKWTASLRDRLSDGCGVLIPSDGDEADPSTYFDCRAGTAMGVEPATNLAPAGAVDDDSSSSPVALPDGGVLYGSFTGYNGSRGHLMKFDASGMFQGAYDFGWDTTPAVIPTAGGYGIVVKDNHYGSDANGVDLGPYFITTLDSSLNVAWQFQNTETQSCVRGPNGLVGCTEDHPHGFEWCINAPAVDAVGTIYGNSEDGHIYAIDSSGHLRDRFFLDRALGAAYTPLALDGAGRVFALNNGTMTVIGNKP
jgi:outer membrane protein assembly factor BamB